MTDKSSLSRMAFPITMEDDRSDREEFESTNWDAISRLVRQALILAAMAMFVLAGWYFFH